VSEDARQEIQVMLVDDHSSFREPLAFMLDREPDLAVVVQAESLSEAREVLGEDDPTVDVAIVDLDLPDGWGTDVIDELREARPQAATLILSALSDHIRLAQTVEAGAAGIMHKSSRFGDIVGAVRRLHTGEMLLSQQEVIEALRLVVREREKNREAQLMVGKLTPREHEVLQALAAGSSDKEIAERLYVGVGTVRSHIESILMKLEVSSRLQALVFAVRHGVVDIF